MVNKTRLHGTRTSDVETECVDGFRAPFTNAVEEGISAGQQYGKGCKFPRLHHCLGCNNSAFFPIWSLREA